jgi:hypothetical protein
MEGTQSALQYCETLTNLASACQCWAAVGVGPRGLQLLTARGAYWGLGFSCERNRRLHQLTIRPRFPLQSSCSCDCVKDILCSDDSGTALSSWSGSLSKKWLQLRFNDIRVFKPYDFLAEYSLAVAEQLGHRPGPD